MVGLRPSWAITLHKAYRYVITAYQSSKKRKSQTVKVKFEASKPDGFNRSGVSNVNGGLTVLFYYNPRTSTRGNTVTVAVASH